MVLTAIRENVKADNAVSDTAATPENPYAIQEHNISDTLNRAASELVALDDQGTTVKIELEGNPYEMKDKLIERLGELGFSPQTQEAVFEEFTSWCIQNGIDFSTKTNTDEITFAMEVTDTPDLADLAGGAYDVMFIKGDRMIRQDMSRVEVGLGIMGTTSTRSAAAMSVEEMIKRGRERGLLIKMASQSSEDVNGMSVEAYGLQGLNAFMGEAGGAAIEALEALIEEGELSPEAEALLEAFAEYQELLEAGELENAADLFAALEENIEALFEEGLDLPENIIEALEEAFEGMEEAAQEITNEASLEETLEIDEDTPEADEEALEADAENADLETVDLKAEDQTLGMDEAEDILDMMQDLLETLEAGEIESLPPEVQELLQSLGDIEAMITEFGPEGAVTQLAAALDGTGNPDLAAAVQEIITTLGTPEIQALLPQEALNETNIFLSENPEIVESVLRETIINELQQSLMDLGAGSETAIAIEQVIEQLQSGEPLSALNTEILAEINEQSYGPVAEHLETVLETLENHAAENETLSRGTLENIEEITRDLETLQSEIAELQPEGTEVTAEQIDLADRLESTIETLNEAPDSLDALVEVVMLQEALDSPEIAEFLPPEIIDVTDRISADLDQSIEMQEIALAIDHEIQVQELQNTVELITELEAARPELEAANIDIDTVIEALERNITAPETTEALKSLISKLEDVTPDLARDLEPLINEIQDLQSPADTEQKFEKPEIETAEIPQREELETKQATRETLEITEAPEKTQYEAPEASDKITEPKSVKEEREIIAETPESRETFKQEIANETISIEENGINNAPEKSEQQETARKEIKQSSEQEIAENHQAKQENKAACPSGGPCDSGGDCDTCKDKFAKVASQVSANSVAKKLDVEFGSFELPAQTKSEKDAPEEIKAKETPKAACPSGGPCDSGGDCDTCKDKFKKVAENVSQNSVAQKLETEFTSFELPAQESPENTFAAEQAEQEITAKIETGKTCSTGAICTSGEDCDSCKDKFKKAAENVSKNSVAVKMDNEFDDFALPEKAAEEETTLKETTSEEILCSTGAVCTSGGDCDTCKDKFKKAAQNVSKNSVAVKMDDDFGTFELPSEPASGTTCPTSGNKCNSGGDCKTCKIDFTKAVENIKKHSIAKQFDEDFDNFELPQDKPDLIAA